MQHRSSSVLELPVISKPDNDSVLCCQRTTAECYPVAIRYNSHPPNPYDPHYYYFITGIQPLGRSGQRPEFSQATGKALVHCILGKFLGVACHCFPPLFRCFHFSPPGVSTSATTLEIPAAEVGTAGENVVQ